MSIGAYVWRVTTNRINYKGNAIFFNFRCGIETLEELVLRLNAGDLILGQILFTKTKSDDAGEYQHIVAAKATAIGKLIVGTVEASDRRFVEFVEARPEDHPHYGDDKYGSWQGGGERGEILEWVPND